MPSPSGVWYAQYDRLRDRVLHLRETFRGRCRELGVSPDAVLDEARQEILARAVHESNWQEGLELSLGRTQELTLAALDELDGIVGPHLDMNVILKAHRDHVVRLKRSGAPVEELATYNLALAHHALRAIGNELATRQAASLAHALDGIMKRVDSLGAGVPEDIRLVVERSRSLLDGLKRDESPVLLPMIPAVETSGDLLNSMLRMEFDHLLHPMRIGYIHFLHRLTLMGIAPLASCGRFRRSHVHVGNFQLHFPVPAAVPAMMEEYCRTFPTVLPNTVKYDPVLVAARASHQFVCIHPYIDGNGRVSRLLMNLVLWGHHPPVYLKADKKGRHRYAQALKRADRGNVEALASLIAMSLIEVYESIIRTLVRPGDSPGS